MRRFNFVSEDVNHWSTNKKNEKKNQHAICADVGNEADNKTFELATPSVLKRTLFWCQSPTLILIECNEWHFLFYSAAAWLVHFRGCAWLVWIQQKQEASLQNLDLSFGACSLSRERSSHNPCSCCVGSTSPCWGRHGCRGSCAPRPRRGTWRRWARACSRPRGRQNIWHGRLHILMLYYDFISEYH